MRPIGVLGLIIASFGIIASFRQYIRRKRILGLILWMIVWLSLGIVSIFPPIVYFIASLFSMVYGPYFIFAVSIMGLYLIVFLLYNALKGLEGQVCHLAQSIALLEYSLERSDQDAKKGGRDDSRSE